MIRTGGKQYRIEANQILNVARLIAEAGATVEFNDVLMVDDAGEVQMGTPLVVGARVVAEVIEQGRDAKILVLKYKNKTRYRRRKGHRQGYTCVAIREILRDGQASRLEVEKPRRRVGRRRTTEEVKEPTAGQPAAITGEVPSLALTEAIMEERRPRSPRASRVRKATEPSKTISQAASRPDSKPARRPRTKKLEIGE